MSHQHTKLRYNRIPFHRVEGEQVLQKVEAHWEKLRSNETVPQQMHLSSENLEDVLSHCFVLERVAPTIARFRVAGKQMTELLGMDARGMPLSIMFSGDGRDVLGPLLQSVCEGPEIVEVPLTATRGLRRAVVRARLLMLPLKDRDSKVTRIFGALVMDGNAGRQPVRFDIDASVPLRCKRLTPMIRTISQMKAAVAEMEDAASVATISKAIPAEAPIPLPSRSARPYLRLVVDNT